MSKNSRNFILKRHLDAENGILEPEIIDIPTIKRKRGRPRKTVVEDPVSISPVPLDVDKKNSPEVKRKPGRPAKVTKTQEPAAVTISLEQAVAAASEELPQRERRYPRRYPLCLLFSYLLMMFCFQVGTALKIESRGSVIFKEEANVGFSESAWTIVTHLPTGKMTNFGTKT